MSTSIFQRTASFLVIATIFASCHSQTKEQAPRSPSVTVFDSLGTMVPDPRERCVAIVNEQRCLNPVFKGVCFYDVIAKRCFRTEEYRNDVDAILRSVRPSPDQPPRTSDPYESLYSKYGKGDEHHKHPNICEGFVDGDPDPQKVDVCLRENGYSPDGKPLQSSQAGTTPTPSTLEPTSSTPEPTPTQ